jgi:Gpi18-like mannosyltransferase
MLLSKRALFWVSVAILIAVAIAIRVSLFGVISDDMEYFLIPWHEHLVQYGYQGIATIASNYNVAYLYILWAVTHLPVPAVVGVKLITIFFEFIFAFVVYLIVREHYSKKSYAPMFAAVGALYIPTILLQGALWGQCDIIYVTFLVLSWRAIIKNKPWAAWLLFGVALAFKLQAIFFLPFLAYWWFASSTLRRPVFTKQNVSLLAPLAAPLVVLVLALPALAAGRSLASSFSVYFTQVADTGNTVSLGSGITMFQLLVDVKDQSILYLSQPAVFIAMAVVIGLIAFYILFNRNTRDKDMYLLPQVILLIIPFMLPYMRNRYSFAAELFTILFALCTRRKWFIITAILLQITVLPRYALYLWNTNVTWDVKYLALVQLAIIIGAIYLLMRPALSSVVIKKS